MLFYVDKLFLLKFIINFLKRIKNKRKHKNNNKRIQNKQNKKKRKNKLNNKNKIKKKKVKIKKKYLNLKKSLMKINYIELNNIIQNKLQNLNNKLMNKRISFMIKLN